MYAMFKPLISLASNNIVSGTGVGVTDQTSENSGADSSSSSNFLSIGVPVVFGGMFIAWFVIEVLGESSCLFNCLVACCRRSSANNATFVLPRPLMPPTTRDIVVNSSANPSPTPTAEISVVKAMPAPISPPDIKIIIQPSVFTPSPTATPEPSVIRNSL